VTAQLASIYLSGSIRKGAADGRPDDYFWTKEDTDNILAWTLQRVRLLNPALTVIDRSDSRVNFGCDLYLVSISDAVIVDLRRKKGIGVGAELAFADAKRIPVFGLLGGASDYRQSVLENIAGQTIENWTHPFVTGLCDEVFMSLHEVCTRVSKLLAGPGLTAAYREKTSAGIDYFLEKNGKNVRFHD
jgi:hypothetical protein